MATLSPGFDTYAFPGFPQTAWLRSKTNADWMAYYLPAPSHPEADWLGHRAALMAQGWGLAPLYVGQQITGEGSHSVNVIQGKIDGEAAAKLMEIDGWEAGSCLYLDIEDGPPASELRVDYCAAWAMALIRAGFRPGFYCSHLMGPDLEASLGRRSIHNARWWVYKMASTTPSNLYLPKLPTQEPDQAMLGATVLQHAQDVTWRLPGAPRPKMLVDLDTALFTDPSAP